MSSKTISMNIERTNRPWGWYETISEVSGYLIKRIHVYAGQQLSLQKHNHRSEHWIVTEGNPTVTIGDEVFELTRGKHCDIVAKQVHRLSNSTSSPVELIEVQFGNILSEDDIVRLQDDYGRN
jgi:mannose-1-phosphate guanylyltransferase/mannose-6-phosphate isomerase